MMMINNKQGGDKMKPEVKDIFPDIINQKWVSMLTPDEFYKNHRCKCNKSYMTYEQYLTHYRKVHAGL